LCASRARSNHFLVCFTGFFGAPLTPAGLARLGARAAIRACATVARSRSMSEGVVKMRFEVGVARTSYARAVKWSVLIGWRVSEERLW